MFGFYSIDQHRIDPLSRVYKFTCHSLSLLFTITWFPTSGYVIINGRKANRPVPAREDFRHLFFDCPVLDGLYIRYLERYGNVQMNDNEKRSFFFTGTADGSWSGEQMIICLHNIIFCYGIWISKLSRKIPSFSTIENNMLTVFDNTVSLSITLTELSTNGTSSISRLWRIRTGHG
jgi:hypothetical protein